MEVYIHLSVLRMKTRPGELKPCQPVSLADAVLLAMNTDYPINTGCSIGHCLIKNALCRIQTPPVLEG